MVRPVVICRSLSEPTEHARPCLISEILQTRGFMLPLMKPRNKQRWSPEDRRRELALHLRRLSYIGPYLAVLVMPGGMLALPVLAWWLGRRRDRRPAGLAVQG